MGIMGPNKKAAWQDFAESMGAEYIDAKAFKNTAKVRLEYKNREIVMDTYTVSTGQSSVTYTRVRAVFVGCAEFELKVFRTSILTKVANFFGKQSSKTGDNTFDEIFTIRSQQQDFIDSIFANDTLKEMLHGLKHVNLLTKKAKGKKDTKYVENERELQYLVTGVIKDADQLTLIFGAMINLLDAFEANEIAKSEKPQISYV